MVLKEPFVMSHIYFNNVLVMKLFLPPFKSTDEVLMQASVEGPGKKNHLKMEGPHDQVHSVMKNIKEENTAER